MAHPFRSESYSFCTLESALTNRAAHSADRVAKGLPRAPRPFTKQVFCYHEKGFRLGADSWIALIFSVIACHRHMLMAYAATQGKYR